jgi:hypothetical protein
MAIETKDVNNYRIEILVDESPSSPREDENIGKMVCFHKRYNLGDKHDYKSNMFDSWDELKARIEEDNNVAVILPLYLYDHSGISISTKSFNDRWDSGQVGWVFCTEEDVADDLMTLSGQDVIERAEVLMNGEVETYNQYLKRRRKIVSIVV